MGIEMETARAISAEFVEKGLIDDADWLQGFILREKRRGASPRAVAEKLKFKGLAAPSIQESIKKIYPSAEEVLSLLIKKKQKGRERPQLIAYLARKGFSLPDIYNALRR